RQLLPVLAGVLRARQVAQQRALPPLGHQAADQRSDARGLRRARACAGRGSSEPEAPAGSRSRVSLDAVAALEPRVAALAWFATVGAPLTQIERDDAAAWLSALDRADIAIDPVPDWAAAKALADAPGWDQAWWVAEERQRTALLAEATARHGRAPLFDALTRITRAMSDPAHDRATHGLKRAGLADEGLARAAAGAATQAGYLAALALAPGQPPSHAFLAKLRLFEAGRWPLGIVTARLWVF